MFVFVSCVLLRVHFDKIQVAENYLYLSKFAIHVFYIDKD